MVYYTHIHFLTTLFPEQPERPWCRGSLAGSTNENIALIGSGIFSPLFDPNQVGRQPACEESSHCDDHEQCSQREAEAVEFVVSVHRSRGSPPVCSIHHSQ